MLARNPKTGAPIRILRSEASLSRNRKTLVWLKDQDASIPYERWDTMCVGVADIQKWEKIGKSPDFFILPETNSESVEFFQQVDYQNYKLMFVPKSLVFAIGVDKFRSLRISNVIILEESNLMYPFIGAAWDTSAEDAVVMVTAIIRASVVVGMSENYSSQRLTTLESQGMKIILSHETPMPLWYITQYYKPEKARREREIKKCLEENVKNPLIDKIVLLNEKDFSEDFPKTTKIQQDILGKRLTYASVVEWIVKNVPDNVICIFGNADIYLDDESWKDIWSVKLDDIFLALLRWDIQEGDKPPQLFGPRNDSQDTWGFLSNSVKSKEWDYKSLNFPFGKAGCDNSITVEMLRKKFLVVNPAVSVKTYHLQLTNYRTYDPQDVVDKACYMYVDPTGIHDMEPVYNLDKYVFEKMKTESFERRVRGTKPKALEVYCKMLERGERYFWKANGTNPQPSESVQLYKYENAFQTPQGLVYGYNKIYVGKEEASKEAWSKSALSPIHPTLKAERSFAIPWKNEFETSKEKYILEYVSKVFQLREKYGKGEFFASEKGHASVLECFRWPEAQLPVISHKPNIQVWCKEIIQIPPAAKSELHKEDIQALRMNLKGGWEQVPSGKKWAVVIDGKYITMDMVRKWETDYSDIEWSVLFEDRTSIDRVIEKIRGASGLICYGGVNSTSRWGFSWLLPKGARVIEIQNEMEPDGEAAHCSGAAELVHSLVIVPRATEKITQEMILSEVPMAMKHVATHSSTKPTIYMPRKSLTGFFAHAGDSFREMVKLWQEREFVDVVEDPKAVQIWLGGIGKTLLYDRPTLDWLFSAPPEEQTWELALFGNPTPTDMGGKAKSWFFWPRSPSTLQALQENGSSQKGWSERVNTCCFHGKIENKVQEKNRSKMPWYEVCDDYSMINGAETPYKLTQAEYLLRLANAKFGLCMAGYGKKCHREVECMAMGCIPVCTPEVDMENYANPPQEGVHYIRAQNPEEAKNKMKAITEEQWKLMSEACKFWWKENASAEGSWKLTQKLLA